MGGGDILSIMHVTYLTTEKFYVTINSMSKSCAQHGGGRMFKMKDSNCIFCKIANGEIPSATVYEDDDFRVILDMGPASKGHALILPKEHFADVCALDEKTVAKVLPLGAKIGSAMKRSLGCAGFNLVQNNGEAAGQTVFHFHMHVIPRYENGPVIAGWTPGKASPEELAQVAQEIKEGLQ